MLIDTHCHLNFKTFEGKVGLAIKRARRAGVEKTIVPGARLDTSKKAVELAQKYKEIYAAVGIHPIHAGKLKFKTSKAKNELKKLAENKKVVSIGECGLDYFRIKNNELRTKVKQRLLFEIQIELAKELGLPLIIHNRNASDDLISVLKPYATRHKLQAVFHCFSGSFTLLAWALEHNFYVGIDGNVTYSKHVKKIVKQTPLKNLLVETDSPYLTPEPIRSTKKFPNEPKNVKIVAEKIAEIKGDSFLKVAKQTTKNAEELFWKK